MFKISFVVRPGRQQRDARVGGRACRFHSVDQRFVSGGQPMHLHLAKCLWKQKGNCQSVFQQVAQARRCLCALRHHPPATVRAACHVKCGNVQKDAAGGLHPLHGAQITRMSLHQRGGQQAPGQQGLRPVHISHHVVEQAGPLAHTGVNLLPVLRRDDQRKQIE